MRPRSRHLLNRDDTVILAIDLQEPFLRSIYERERLVDRCRVLISAACLLDVPVVLTTQFAERMGTIIPEISSILPEKYRDPIDKLIFSAAGSQALTDRLAQLKREQIVLCGVETHICVQQSALDLTHLEYSVHYAADAVSSRTQFSHELGRHKMDQCSVLANSAEGIIMELLYEAGTPAFKNVLRLIK